MKASGRGGPADEREQREVVELVSKPELDRAQRQIERLQKENERRNRWRNSYTQSYILKWLNRLVIPSLARQLSLAR